MRTRPLHVRALAALLSIGLGVGMVALRIHQAAVAHAYCAEHGVLEDRDESARPTGDPQTSERDRGRHSSEHEACAFAMLAQPVQPASVAPPLTAAQEVANAPISPAPTSIGRLFPVLSVAPKTSPPLLVCS